MIIKIILSIIVVILSITIIIAAAYFIYYLSTIDLSEMKKRENTVFAMYGHTSWFDSIVGLSMLLNKSLKTKVIVKQSYENILPSIIKKKVIFVQPGSHKPIDTITEKYSVGFEIEGTRAKKDHIHKGFYYYAKKNNMNITLCAFDFKKRKVYCEDVDPEKTSISETLEILKSFISTKKLSDISMYPSYCSDLRFK